MEAEELFYRRRSSLRSGLGDAVEFGAVRRRKQETLPRGPHRHAKEPAPPAAAQGRQSQAPLHIYILHGTLLIMNVYAIYRTWRCGSTLLSSGQAPLG